MATDTMQREALCRYCHRRVEFYHGGTERPSIFWCGFCGAIRIKGPAGQDYWKRPAVYEEVELGLKMEVRT